MRHLPKFFLKLLLMLEKVYDKPLLRAAGISGIAPTSVPYPLSSVSFYLLALTPVLSFHLALESRRDLAGTAAYIELRGCRQAKKEACEKSAGRGEARVKAGVLCVARAEVGTWRRVQGALGWKIGLQIVKG